MEDVCKYFMDIWYILRSFDIPMLWTFGILYHEKSGNPVSDISDTGMIRTRTPVFYTFTAKLL
jgi:hypothetical protein